MGLFDEETERSRSEDWAAKELARGRLADEITLDLVGNGWPPGDAEDICAAARKAAGKQPGAFGTAGLFKSISRLWNPKDPGQRK